MWQRLKRRESSPTSQATSLEGQVEQIQAGDQELRSQILMEYQPFVLRVASDVCGRFIARDEDEFSIGLAALNEALDQYDSERASFISFAEMVIRHRIIDYLRKLQREERQVVRIQEEEKGSTPFVDQALLSYRLQEEQQARAREIAQLEKELAQFQITFEELVKRGPKHEDARQSARAVVELIVSKPEWVASIRRTKQLPLKELEGHVAVSRKTLERQRKYLIAMLVIIEGNYPYLQTFLHLTKKGGEHS